MASILDTLKDAQGGVKKSADWYRKNVTSLADRVTARRLMNQGKLIGRPSTGRLNMFFYDPKTKARLPYYDVFPLVLPLEPIKGGFLGLNFHYLPYGLRVQLFRRMLSFASDNNFDEKTTINVSWRQISSIRAVRPSIKSYLFSQVRSAFLNIRVNEMPVALNLPVQRFVGATDAKVYTDTRKMI